MFWWCVKTCCGSFEMKIEKSMLNGFSCLPRLSEVWRIARVEEAGNRRSLRQYGLAWVTQLRQFGAPVIFCLAVSSDPFQRALSTVWIQVPLPRGGDALPPSCMEGSSFSCRPRGRDRCSWKQACVLFSISCKPHRASSLEVSNFERRSLFAS